MAAPPGGAGGGKGEVWVLAGPVSRQAPPRPAVWLGTAVPKGRRWPWLVEKAVEAGVDVLQPVRFARGVARAEGDPGRWRSWALAACKQCRRAFLPDIRAPLPLDAWLEAASGPDRPWRLFGAVDGPPPPSWPARPDGVPDRVCLSVGPEGDFTPGERRALLDAGWEPARWGAHALRVETAAVLGVAAVRMAAAGRDPAERPPPP